MQVGQDALGKHHSWERELETLPTLFQFLHVISELLRRIIPDMNIPDTAICLNIYLVSKANAGVKERA